MIETAQTHISPVNSKQLKRGSVYHRDMMKAPRDWAIRRSSSTWLQHQLRRRRLHLNWQWHVLCHILQCTRTNKSKDRIKCGVVEGKKQLPW